MITITNIILTVFILLWALAALYSVSGVLALSSKSKMWRWLRRLRWSFIIHKYRERHIGNYKVHTYFMKYLVNSIAARHFYVTHGYDEFKAAMIGKIEELERFVEEYKYNTFGQITPDEEKFIDEYIKKHRHD